MLFFSFKKRNKDNTATHEAAVAREKDIDNIANYETAIACAKGCSFNMRPGDPEQNFSVLDVGVRVMVQDFGRFQPFIFSDHTKGWIKEHFDLTDRQTSKVYSLLYSRLTAFLREQETAAAKDRRFGAPKGDRFSWLSKDRLKTTSFL